MMVLGLAIHVGNHLKFRYGMWSSVLSERSSNYREFRNLVDNLKGLCKDGSLRGCKVFFVPTRSLDTFPGDLAWEMLRSVEKEGYRIIRPQDEERFDLSPEEYKTMHLVVRDGDHLTIPFQCEPCHFRNLKGTDPSKRSEDILLLRIIIRANVDELWSRDPGTVNATLRERRKIDVIGRKLGVNDVLPSMGPFPLKDT